MNKTVSVEKLLHCPYCGNPGDLDCFSFDPCDWQVNCSNYDCFNSEPRESPRFDNQEDAIKAWNKRTIQSGNLSETDQNAEMVEIKEVCDRIENSAMMTLRIDDIQALVNHARNTDISELVEALKVKNAALEAIIKHQAIVGGSMAEMSVIRKIAQDALEK